MAVKRLKGFIPIKDKRFPTYFSDENLEKIWDFFKSHFNDIKGQKLNWKNEYYVDSIKGYINIPLYPESDVNDNSEGIQPKQISRIIDLIGFDGFTKLAKILSKNISYFIAQDTEDTDYFYCNGESREDTIISWKEVINDFIMDKVKNKDIEYFGKVLFADALGIPNMGTTFTKEQFPYSISKEVFKSIISDNLELEKVMFFKTNKIYDSSETLTLKNLNAEDFFGIREKEWKDKHGLTPKNKSLLLLDPEFWDRTVFLDSMMRMYKTKNLQSLSQEDQDDFIRFYKSFGKLLSLVAPMINQEKIHKPSISWPSLYRSDIPEGLKKILANLGRGIDIKLKVADILNIYLTMSHFKDSNEFILKRNRISIDDIEQLLEVGSQLKNMSEEDLDELGDIPWRYIGVFKKYNVNNTKSILELYAKTKDNKLNIPVLSGKMGAYNWNITGKADIRGLVAGNATNCCQHIPGGIGKSCVYYGAESKHSTFFIITDKAGSIVCQSWIWETDGVLVCDSAEAVRQDNTFYDIYMEMAEEVVNASKTIKEVRIGSTGRAFNKTLKRVDSAVSVPDVPSESKFSYGRGGQIYSDATYQQLLYKK